MAHHAIVGRVMRVSVLEHQRDDRFELTVMNYADPFAKIAIAKIEIAGHMFWRGDTEENRPTNLQIPMTRKP